MGTTDFKGKVGKYGLHKFDIGYLIIISSVCLLYWYLGLNIEIVDFGMIMAMFWFYWKFETTYPNLWSEFKLKKPLVAFISVSCGLISRIIVKIIMG
jgi:hypothetical protein